MPPAASLAFSFSKETPHCFARERSDTTVSLKVRRSAFNTTLCAHLFTGFTAQV